MIEEIAMRLRHINGFWVQTGFGANPNIPAAFNCSDGKVGGWKTVGQHMHFLLKHGTYAESRKSAFNLGHRG